LKECIILLNGPEFNRENFLKHIKNKPCFIIAADGGINHIKDIKTDVDLHIGDMDSSNLPSNSSVRVIKKETYPVKKDFSDYFLALEKAVEFGYDDIVVYGACGGRIDHFLSNYETTVSYANKNSLNIVFSGIKEEIYFRYSPLCLYLKPDTTFSVYSGTESIKNLTIKGAEYETEKIEIRRDVPLGLSNVSRGETSIEFSDGIAVIIVNRGL